MNHKTDTTMRTSTLNIVTSVMWGLIILTLSLPTAIADTIKKAERWDRAICLKSTEKKGGKDGSVHLATGFLVKHEKQLILVTAEHAARKTNKDTRLLFRDRNGKPQWVVLELVCSAGQSPWKHFQNSDLATARLVETETSKPYIDNFRALAVPIENIMTENAGRATDIDVAGFPLGMGLQREVSPIVVKGHISSREISTENEWGAEPIIYSFPDLAQGTSGGPVFRSDPDPHNVVLVGMYVGVVFDASGGKLSKLIPGRLVHAAVLQHSTEQDPEKS